MSPPPPAPLRQPIPLDGEWHAAVSTDGLRRSFAEPETATGPDWHPIDVPGHWQAQDAFGDAQGPVLHRHRWDDIGHADVAGQRAWLHLDGIFYSSEVWLDGDLLGDTEGYFMGHTFEVTEQLGRATEHLLAVEVACPPVGDPRNKRSLTGVYQHSDSLDDDRNPGGIWRPVTVSRTGPVRILRQRVLCTEATATRAVVQLHVTLDSLLPRHVALRTEIAGHDHHLEASLAAGETSFEWSVAVNDPLLWWPRSLGPATLHDLGLEVRLDPDDPEYAAVEDCDGLSDRVVLRTGLRSVQRREWVFSVNGERMFLKGANQPPLRRFPADETPEVVRRVLGAATGANLDLLRFWGHVPTPEVLDACDEAGLLAWIDMPLQWGYHRSVKAQAVRQARSLVDLHGHRPSIVLWCAHNEPFAVRDPRPPGGNHLGRALHRLRAVGAQQLPSWNRSVLDPAIAEALTAADPSREVEAHSGMLPHLPLLDGGDTHLFAGWGFGSARTLDSLLRALPRLGRFVSAFGAASVPPEAGFCEPGAFPHLDWDHLGRRHGLDRALFDAYVPPIAHQDFDRWRRATQARQADLVQHQVATLRRLKYRPAGGFCVHLLVDAEPMVSCSLVSSEGTPKPAWLSLADACAPVLVTADRLPVDVSPGDRVSVRLHLVNDLRVPVEGEVHAELRWPGGGVRRRWSGTAPADSVVRIGGLEVALPLGPVAPGPDAELSLRIVFEDPVWRSVWADRAPYKLGPSQSPEVGSLGAGTGPAAPETRGGRE